jgi:hypothetical protein
MQPVAGHIQRLRRPGSIKNRQYPFDGFQQVWTDPSPVSLLIEPFQTAMAKAPDH